VGRGSPPKFGAGRDVRQAGPLRIFRALSRSVGNRIEADVAALTVPVLVVGGDRDPVARQRWRTTLGPSVAVPRAPHNVATTAGRYVADTVAAFLDPAL
jgi:pimeloyl-ACP methyl ester carboxylesterase